MGVKVTIFTPTYERASTLGVLYESLKKQTCKDFEWLVVDDGSTDNTKDLFNTWIDENEDFPIRYYYQENGGKHRAINFATDKAKGDLFFIVDSDDYILEEAVETIIREEKKIDNPGFSLAGIGFNKGLDENNIVGETFKGESVIVSSIDRSKYNIIGDKSEVFYTDILKKYKFPEFPGENFITENVVWYKIANDGYKIKWINKTIYICEYLDGGLTKNANSLALNNFTGYTYSVRELLGYDISSKEKMILIGVYTRISRQRKDTYPEISDNINQNIIVCFILGLASKISSNLKYYLSN